MSRRHKEYQEKYKDVDVNKMYQYDIKVLYEKYKDDLNNPQYQNEKAQIYNKYFENSWNAIAQQNYYKSYQEQIAVVSNKYKDIYHNTENEIKKLLRGDDPRHEVFIPQIQVWMGCLNRSGTPVIVTGGDGVQRIEQRTYSTQGK